MVLNHPCAKRSGATPSRSRRLPPLITTLALRSISA
jgi:hypothetical protein